MTFHTAEWEAGNVEGEGGWDAEPAPLANTSMRRGWGYLHKSVFQARSLSAQGTLVSFGDTNEVLHSGVSWRTRQ